MSTYLFRVCFAENVNHSLQIAVQLVGRATELVKTAGSSQVSNHPVCMDLHTAATG